MSAAFPLTPALGRVTVITNALGSFTNAYLRATALITTNFCPKGKKTIFSYLSVTNDQRLASIWNQKTNSVTLSKFSYAYDAVGQITNWTQQVDTASTNVQVIAYDPVNQLLSVTVRSNTVAGAILKQYAYGYDAGGNRTTEQVGSGSATTTPVAMSQSTYKSNNQLTSRTGGTGQMLFAGSLNEQGTVTVAGTAAAMNHFTTNFYGYTSVTNGTNVIPVKATDYSANSATNKYQVVVTNNGMAKTITFDLNGNETAVVTATSTNTYQWDAANRLVSITGPTNQSLFGYDGLGRRVQIIEKTNGVAMGTNKFLWLGKHISDQRSSTGIVVKRFFGQGEQISGTNYFFTRDHLGSIREMVDGSGTIQARYDYNPYGQRTKISGSLDADFGFTGHYVHAASGLHLAPFRAYDAEIARWLSRDPLNESAGLNLYNYVLNNPLNWSDPLGLCQIGGTLEGEAAHVYGFDTSFSGVWDTKTPENSGYYTSVGPAMGETFGFGFGFVFAMDSVAGKTKNLDVNAGMISITVPMDSESHEFAGFAVTCGPGVGAAISQTDTDPLYTISDFIHDFIHHYLPKIKNWLSHH